MGKDPDFPPVVVRARLTSQYYFSSVTDSFYDVEVRFLCTGSHARLSLCLSLALLSSFFTREKGDGSG